MIEMISIRGARTHNLDNISLDFPRNKLIVVTGVSGSGKSSLVFNTLYAGAERRFIESLPAYVRQFLSMMEKPDVEHMSGLSPAISIQQKTIAHNPRSTVGTVTEIYDYLRVLFARVGEPYCPDHNIRLDAQSISQMADHIAELPQSSRFLLLAPVLQKKKGEHYQLLEHLKRQGYLRIRLNGIVTELADVPPLDRTKHHTIEVIVDRLVYNESLRARLVDSLATTVQLGNGLVRVVVLQEESSTIHKEFVFSSRFACPECDYSIAHLEPRLFSFNNTMGACPECNGLGVELSVAFQDAQHRVYDRNRRQDFLFSQPAIETQHGETAVCKSCQGERLCKGARHVLLTDRSLPQLSDLALNELFHFFKNLTLKGQRAEIAKVLLKEITNRLEFLLNVGLDYLSLNRAAGTLSGGEAQRIRLASQIGSGLVGIMYILDEPSIGLHARDNTRLLNTLYHLRDLGNTVIVVEHDEEAIRQADHVVDIGPQAGIHGGRIVAQGTPQEIMKVSNSLTGQYLSGAKKIKVPSVRKSMNPMQILSLTNITNHNLQSVTAEFPLGLMTCVTGVSGSGKSTLIEVLYNKLSRYMNRQRLDQIDSIKGVESLNKIIEINQQPIGRTPRSNPATYTGILDPIRELFAATTEARSRGYTPGRFSFNVKGGRCEACEGGGQVKVEMHFLADLHVLCDLCQGKRYNQETLEIKYKSKNIYEILSMTVEEASEFFKAIPVLTHKLRTLVDVGLSYITLGQSATTLSGGEAQRIKLAKELSRKMTGSTLYILDEPTTGLHFYDIGQLLKILHRLRDHGNTVIVIEHNLDVIKTADWIMDLGPEGGSRGGKIIACGTPEMLAQCKNSYTGQYLKPLLENTLASR